jgi:hypothetical protein
LLIRFFASLVCRSKGSVRRPSPLHASSSLSGHLLQLCVSYLSDVHGFRGRNVRLSLDPKADLRSSLFPSASCSPCPSLLPLLPPLPSPFPDGHGQSSRGIRSLNRRRSSCRSLLTSSVPFLRLNLLHKAYTTAFGRLSMCCSRRSPSSSSALVSERCFLLRCRRCLEGAGRSSLLPS